MKQLFIFISIICMSMQTYPSAKTRIGLCIASASTAYMVKNKAFSDDHNEKLSSAVHQAKRKISKAICQLCETNFFYAAVESHQRAFGK
jgi:hypothetical protein